MRRGYELAKQLDQASQARSHALLEEYYRTISKFEQQRSNLTRMCTDPDIKMKKSEYLAQKAQFESEIKEAQN